MANSLLNLISTLFRVAFLKLPPPRLLWFVISPRLTLLREGTMSVFRLLKFIFNDLGRHLRAREKAIMMIWLRVDSDLWPLGSRDGRWLLKTRAWLWQSESRSTSIPVSTVMFTHSNLNLVTSSWPVRILVRDVGLTRHRLAHQINSFIRAIHL